MAAAIRSKLGSVGSGSRHDGRLVEFLRRISRIGLRLKVQSQQPSKHLRIRWCWQRRGKLYSVYQGQLPPRISVTALKRDFPHDAGSVLLDPGAAGKDTLFDGVARSDPSALNARINLPEVAAYES